MQRKKLIVNKGHFQIALLWDVKNHESRATYISIFTCLAPTYSRRKIALARRKKKKKKKRTAGWESHEANGRFNNFPSVELCGACGARINRLHVCERDTSVPVSLYRTYVQCTRAGECVSIWERRVCWPSPLPLPPPRNFAGVSVGGRETTLLKVAVSVPRSEEEGVCRRARNAVPRKRKASRGSFLFFFFLPVRGCASK